MQTRVQVVALTLMIGLTAPFALAEQVGTSTEDLPNYSGAYSIENRTNITIHYQYRWGNNQPWKSMTLASGHVETHSYPLGEDRNKKLPTPYVRFDRIGGDRRITLREYRMQFYAVGYAGFGPRQHTTRPKRYAFHFAGNGRDLDLRAE